MIDCLGPSGMDDMKRLNGAQARYMCLVVIAAPESGSLY
jgi:hypothetical protein